jgi:hypothetical protein
LISKIKKIIDFLDELGLFIEEKPVFTKKKKIPSLHMMAVHMKILSARFFKDAFKLETSPFGSLKELVRLGLVFIFDFKNKFRRVATIRIFSSFFISMWKIYQFLCFWAWFDVKFYAELKKVYFMGSEMQPGVTWEPKNGIC